MLPVGVMRSKFARTLWTGAMLQEIDHVLTSRCVTCQQWIEQTPYRASWVSDHLPPAMPGCAAASAARFAGCARAQGLADLQSKKLG